MKKLNIICNLLILCFTVTGCTHPLTIKNLNMYSAPFIQLHNLDVSLGITSITSDIAEERLVRACAEGLKKAGFNIFYPYYENKNQSNKIDYKIKISTISEFKGSGMNFLVNWPGFLIWTPAWHGYNYQTKFVFDIDIVDTTNQVELPRIKVPMDLVIRHAAINRTWTEISWLEWSVIAFVGGICFTQYDPSVTGLLLEKYEMKLGDYISSKIAETIIATEKSKEQ